MALSEEQLGQHVTDALAEGFEIVQEGRVLSPDAVGVSFAERVEGFRASMLGSHSAPTYRSEYENRLFDSEERWVHLRRLRRAGA